MTTQLSPLAQRIYDVLARNANLYYMMATWEITQELGAEISTEALEELKQAYLVEPSPRLGDRYQLTPRAWQSLLSAERERARLAEEDNAILLACLRDIEYGCDWMPERIQALLDTIQQAEHPGRTLMGELTRRMGAAQAVVAIARRGFGTAEDVTRAEAFDPVALTRAIEAYDQAVKK